MERESYYVKRRDIDDYYKVFILFNWSFLLWFCILFCFDNLFVFGKEGGCCRVGGLGVGVGVVVLVLVLFCFDDFCFFIFCCFERFCDFGVFGVFVGVFVMCNSFR